jgi:environmental stress-induced protein Ves
MPEIDSTTKAFGFANKDAEDLYKAVLILTDAEFQNELEKVMNQTFTGEARVHAAGRCSAFNDMLRLFQANRDYMLKARIDGKQSNPSQST